MIYDSNQRLKTENTVRIMLHSAEKISTTSFHSPEFNCTQFNEVLRSTFDITRPVYVMCDQLRTTGGTGAGAWTHLVWNELPTNNQWSTKPILNKTIASFNGNTANNSFLINSSQMSPIELNAQSLLGYNKWTFQFLNGTTAGAYTDAIVGTSFLISLVFYQKPDDQIQTARPFRGIPA